MSETRKQRRDIVKLTDAAINRIRHLVDLRKREAPDKPSIGIKVKVKSGGCSGLSYVVEYADEIGKLDEKIEIGDLMVVIEAKAVMYLLGTTMDYIEEELKSGFIFINPNEKGRCGCGESFHV